tara:strand:+ start:103 stop:237 length:135 start_codon:yes stop_codon:yes gene_type:complete
MKKLKKQEVLNVLKNIENEWSDFMPIKEHMKKCEEIIIKSINNK